MSDPAQTRNTAIARVVSCLGDGGCEPGVETGLRY